MAHCYHLQVLQHCVDAAQCVVRHVRSHSSLQEGSLGCWVNTAVAMVGPEAVLEEAEVLRHDTPLCRVFGDTQAQLLLSHLEILKLVAKLGDAVF